MPFRVKEAKIRSHHVNFQKRGDFQRLEASRQRQRQPSFRIAKIESAMPLCTRPQKAFDRLGLSKNTYAKKRS